MASFKKNSGFSLIESIVVIAVAVILTSIVVVYTRLSENQIIFFKEQSLLVSSILRAKAFSIETFQPEIQPGLDTSITSKICGWGIYFEKNSYVIFRDIAQGQSNLDCANANNQYNGPNEKFEEFILPRQVEIKCMALVSNQTSDCANANNQVSRANVIFIPPEPKVVFTTVPGNFSGSELVIDLELSDGARKSVIRISNAGQVSFN